VGLPQLPTRVPASPPTSGSPRRPTALRRERLNASTAASEVCRRAYCAPSKGGARKGVPELVEPAVTASVRQEQPKPRVAVAVIGAHTWFTTMSSRAPALAPAQGPLTPLRVGASFLLRIRMEVFR
jgi:hypothetical protein